MTIRALDHIGIMVEDLDAAKEIFIELGMTLEGESEVQGEWVDKLLGIDGVHTRIAMLGTTDGRGHLELTQAINPPGSPDARVEEQQPIRRLTFTVDDLDESMDKIRARGGELVGEVVQYEDVYRLCYARVPAAGGMLLILSEPLQ